MCQTQKEALFNLVVVGLALATVLSLYPVFGPSAAAGFGLLGLLGLGPVFYRKRRCRIVADERDHLIQRRATIIAYTVFWLAFVASAMLALGFYGAEGAVPVMVVMNAVWLGVMLVVAMHAIATLVQYGWGGVDERS
jgi:hypothetical protein